MKKLMLVAAVTIASVSAHASKARLDSLQNAAQLEDFTYAFDGRAEDTLNYEAALVEFGGSGSYSSPDAEGGFIRKMGDAALGFYMGKPSTSLATGVSSFADAYGTTTDEKTVIKKALGQSNPIEVTYAAKAGDMAWGVGLFATGSDQKLFTANSGTEYMQGKITQNIYGVYAGVNAGAWDAQVRAGLQGDTKFTGNGNATYNTMAGLGTTDEIKIQSTGNVKVSGRYRMDTMTYYASYESLAGNIKVNGVKKSDTTNDTTTVGVVDSKKKDGVDFFYGVSLVSNVAKDKDATVTANQEIDTFSMPLLVGVEADANSWLTLRGAISQNLPFASSVKYKGTGSGATAVASTTTTLGAGIKWGKATIDGVLGMGSTGQFGTDNASNMFTNAALTYNF